MRLCRVEGCERPHWGRGYCRRHYGRWSVHGDPLKVLHIFGRTGCSVEGCEGEHAARGYCSIHLRRFYRRGEPSPRERPPWAEDEIKHLVAVLDASRDGLGKCEPGELAALALHLERPYAGVSAKICQLRRARRDARGGNA